MLKVLAIVKNLLDGEEDNFLDNTGRAVVGEPYAETIDGDTGTKTNNYDIYIVDDNEYEEYMNSLAGVYYKDTAGTDMSSIFCPYELVHDNVDYPDLSEMPRIVSGSNAEPVSDPTAITLEHYIPFKLDETNTNAYNRDSVDDEGSHSDVVTGRFYTGNTSQVRNRSNYRSIGLRGPLIVCGWGFDTAGMPVPYPVDETGDPILTSDPPTFINGATKGHQVDPRDYYSAPVDLRWDQAKKMWVATGSGEGGVWAKITGHTEISTNRWSYNLLKQDLKLLGTFADDPAMTAYVGYNTIEANNDGSGIEGSGDDVSTLPALGDDVELQPIGVGAVVRLRQYVDCDGLYQWLFTVPNNIGGTCDDS